MTASLEQSRGLSHVLDGELRDTSPDDRCGKPMHDTALTCGRHRDHATTGILARESHAAHLADGTLVTWLDTP